jgi:hypothetical protein
LTGEPQSGWLLVPIEGLPEQRPESRDNLEFPVNEDSSDLDGHTAVIEIDQVEGGYSLLLRYLGGSTDEILLNIRPEDRVYPTIRSVGDAIYANLQLHPGKNRAHVLTSVAQKVLDRIAPYAEDDSRPATEN